MPRMLKACLTLLALTFFTACTQEPESVRQTTGQTASQTASQPAADTPTSPTAAQPDESEVTDPLTVPAEEVTTDYDPAKDPLVNPPRMFEPAPLDQPEIIAEDETLIRVLNGNPSSLNPIFGSSVQDFSATSPLYTGLFSFDKDMIWFVNDEVVESFEESEDHLVTRVRIRPGIKWHDGRPWTAHDIRFSWQAILDEQVPCPAAKPGTDQIDDVRVIDDLTVEFVHKQALPTNKWNMMFSVIPKHIYDNPDERAADPSLNTSEYYNRYNREGVVGSGPYKLVEWIPNDRLVFERWPEFQGKLPHFKKIIMKIQPDSNTALMLFKKGDLDEIDLTSQQFATQTSDADFSSVGVKAYAPQWSFSYIGWNMDGSNPFFTDVLVRTALAHAMDYEGIISRLFYNIPTRCHGIYHPDSWMYNPNIDIIDFNLEKASALLDEAGWLLSDDDGWRYKEIGGLPVRLEFTLTIPRESPTSPKIAAVFAQDLKKIGVSMNTQVLEWAAFQKKIRAHDYQSQIAGWGTGTDPDSGWNLWRTEEYENGRNYGGYSNEHVDALFEQGRAEFDPDKRALIYQEIQQAIYEDQPYLFLFNSQTLWGIHKRIRGVQFSPRGLFGFDPGDTAWWVHKDEMLRP